MILCSRTCRNTPSPRSRWTPCSTGPGWESSGYPYGTPVNFVVMDGRIFFHGRKVGEKVSNLKRDPRCCFTVVEEKGFERCDDGACNTTSLYESVIIRGKVQIIDDDDLKMRILRATVGDRRQAHSRKEDGRDRCQEGPTHRHLRDRPRVQDRQVPLRRTRAQDLPVKPEQRGVGIIRHPTLSFDPIRFDWFRMVRN